LNHFHFQKKKTADMSIKFFIGYEVIGYFLFLSMGILLVAGISLLMPETFWKQVWFFKKAEYRQMLPYRIWIGCGFWILAIILACAGIGWFKRLSWGWRLTVGIFAVNGLSDGVRLVMGNYVEGSIGVCITAGIIFYLTRPSVKKLFLRGFNDNS